MRRTEEEDCQFTFLCHPLLQTTSFISEVEYLVETCIDLCVWKCLEMFLYVYRRHICTATPADLLIEGKWLTLLFFFPPENMKDAVTP